jgi:anti-anti-sigma factor
MASAGRLRQVLTDASRRHPARVVVDLTHVTFIDSTGIAALLGGHRAAQAPGVPFTTSPPRTKDPPSSASALIRVCGLRRQ